MSDVHLGSFREKELRELNILAFEKAIDVCLDKKADFIVIAGDFFDIALPEMGVIDRAVRKMRFAQQQGLSFYLVYGSHDYSPTGTSVIDVLCSAGVLTKVSTEGDEKRTLRVFKDEKTGVSFAGVSARARGLEEKDFEKLDYSNLDSIPNPKIFVFHSAITEYTRQEFHGIAGGVSINSLPKGFDYYATGHVHLPQVIRDKALNDKPLVYPGPLFASDYRDLEELSKKKHGFWFCELENGESKVERIEIDVCEVEFIEYNASNKMPQTVQSDLIAFASGNLSGKVVLMRVSGALQSGSPKEIDFSAIRDKAISQGARVFYLNRNSLEAKEKEEIVVSLADANRVEDELFSKSLSSFQGSDGLKGQSGVSKSKKLLGVLKGEPLPGESKSDFESKVVKESKQVLSG